LLGLILSLFGEKTNLNNHNSAPGASSGAWRIVMVLDLVSLK